MKRLSFVMNIPSPYRLHTFRVMYAECQRRGIDFHVHFMARGHKERPASWLNPQIDFPHAYWRDWGYKTHHFNPGLILELLRNPPDWIHLGSPFDTFTCIALAFLSRRAILCAGCEGNTKTPGRMHGFLGWFKRLVFSRCPFVTVPGADGARYVALHQSFTKRRMPSPILLPNLVDETRFRPREQWPSTDVAACRQGLGVKDDERLCLIPARLSPVKGLVPFMELLSRTMLAQWKIVIMGQGELRDEILAKARERQVEDRVTILDYVKYDDMPRYYAAADLLLLPSIYDPNPLSLIEAVHSGLPIAASCQCGNIDEAVTDRRNGWVLPVGEKESFARKLAEVFSTDLARLQAMGRYSYEHNAQFWRSDLAIGKYLDEVVSVLEGAK